jgi:hypothetical protein
MSNNDLRFNYIFFRGAIQIFHNDLKVFAENISSVPQEELLFLMAGLVAIKEDIELLEKVYLELNP